jgi:hypothetical protein
MFYITGSLWTSILMHFVNNGASVILYYLGNIGVIEDAESWGETNNVWIVATSAVVTLALIIWSWKKAQSKQVSDSTSFIPNEGNN